MSLPWLYTILAIAAALTLSAIVILVGHQSEEHGGYLDLTGIKPKRGYQWPEVSRPRAQAGPSEVGLEVGFELLTETDGAKLPPHLRAFLARNAELAGLSETELARRVAIQEQPRGADAA